MRHATAGRRRVPQPARPSPPPWQVSIQATTLSPYGCKRCCPFASRGATPPTCCSARAMVDAAISAKTSQFWRAWEPLSPNLVSQAELKALQAQINPHFLFNSLNTLYGTIDRSNTEARRLVLNLADVYRYLLRSERTL